MKHPTLASSSLLILLLTSVSNTSPLHLPGKATATRAQPGLKEALAASEEVPKEWKVPILLFMTKFLLLRSMLAHAAHNSPDPQLIAACRRLCGELKALAKELERLECDASEDGATTRACFGCPSGSFNFKGWVNAIKNLYEAVYLAATRLGGVTYITPTEVAAGYTITAPGSYLLTAPASYTGSDAAITINSPGVTLDLGGHRITGSGSGTNGIEVASGVSLYTIQNGTLTNFTIRGIDASSAGGDGALVRNINCIACRQFGILMWTYLAHVKNCSFNDTTTGSGAGMNSVLSRDIVAEQCSTHNNGVDGFQVGSASGTNTAVLKDCQATNNGRYGVNYGGNVTTEYVRSLIMGCYAADNTGSGFFSSVGTADPSLVNNHADGNDTGSTSPTNYAGFATVPPGVGHHFESTDAYSWEFWECLDLP